jgi:PPK2 family polyphosphate:nucleotide phosphotransferase
MFEAVGHPHLVPFDGKFKVAKVSATPPEESTDRKKNRKKLRDFVAELDRIQRVLYADDRHAVLIIFQALDAAGKDGTIRAVMSGVNPAGCQSFSFKQPTPKELDHDFLWRTHRSLPERGRIGIFNRSYYEEVLVVRVHPEFLENQRLPYSPRRRQALWKERYESIVNHELHLARNGTVILKFWLNISRDEQKRRFLARIDEPDKNWKFSEADIRERRLWPLYMQAYQDSLRATSRPWAPWYAIPADDKPYTRRCVAEIIVENLRKLPLSYPSISAQRREEFLQMRHELEKEDE